ncbi:hypothetical protein PSEUBRA_005341 [Kalmanozyma brasiliensis GHG001]|uniref:uncharacterized protein n=1 Tax=Kalmanozyma brasiliensis (strain GHG001) TaxID=1365824 RepID=UPI002867B86F|nr:uncharacterized protein PSEUBRA_005341 [Kalmanozyma brasiliensis GHG001]KAF6767511.1 hypothetical protein PSEUBRA_005341 [Kalmanozyma brasiliensis GHG001]
MPPIVAEFAETRALWGLLHDSQHLPGDYVAGGLEHYRNDNWHLFLKNRGHDIIADEWKQVPAGERGQGAAHTIKKMTRFAKDPSSHREMWVETPGPKKVASQLIEAYAKSLKEHDHIYAVSEHMRLPDDAAHLLVPGRSA